MPEPLKVRNRARVREKEAARLRDEVVRRFAAAPWAEGAHVDRGTSQRGDVLLVKQQVVGFFVERPAAAEAPGAAGGGAAGGGAGPEVEEVLVPSVRALLASPPSRSFVTVDMGAVPFVTKGADIMGPGIVESDPALLEGDPLWIRDERNRKPLAVGLALVPGGAMPKQPGKKVKNLHRVGDELWAFEG